MADVFSMLDVGKGTNVGYKRKKNEDSLIALLPPADDPQSSAGALFIVADGMGGLGGGDIASQAALDKVMEFFYNRNNRQTNQAERLLDALEAANTYVREQAMRVSLPRIGTTGAGISLRPDGKMVAFNVGDCRVYRVRGDKIERISRDQSVMERQIEQGMTEAQARASRNSMVTAFIGQPGSLQPYYIQEDVQNGDIYCICSDGLWSLVESNVMGDTLKSLPAQKAVDKLISLALAAGGTDNISAVVVRVGKPPAARKSILLPALASLVVMALTAGLFALSSNDPQLLAGGTQGATLVNTVAHTETPIPPTTAIPATPTTESTATPAIIQVIRETPTFTPTRTPTFTSTPTPTFTLTPSKTASITPTKPPSLTPTQTATVTPTLTLTTAVPTTRVPTTPTATNTVGVTNAPTRNTPAAITSTATATKGVGATNTPTRNITATTTSSPTSTTTASVTRTPSRTSTKTLTVTASITATGSRTPTRTPTSTRTNTSTSTPRPTLQGVTITLAPTATP
jgi:serine/threonine protein phosphatase PrpC